MSFEEALHPVLSVQPSTYARLPVSSSVRVSSKIIDYSPTPHTKSLVPKVSQVIAVPDRID